MVGNPFLSRTEHNARPVQNLICSIEGNVPLACQSSMVIGTAICSPVPRLVAYGGVRMGPMSKMVWSVRQLDLSWFGEDGG